MTSGQRDHERNGATGLIAPPGAEPTLAILDRNLAALTLRSPAIAQLIREADARPDVAFITADDGALSATLGTGPGAHALASKRRPLDEAARLAESVPIESAAGLVVLGFGLGHHVAALCDRMRRTGVVLVYEPDAALLRAVLERIDYSALFRSGTVVLLHDPEDASAVSRAFSGVEGVVALGVKLVDHPPSRGRLGASADRFGRRVTEVMRAVRMTIVTTLVQVEVTIRNLLMNLDHYAVVPGVQDLAGACRAKPAVLVAAGPSLERNLDLLTRPGVRERVVIIAVQTVLKKLLARGIRPHYVTALDYHEVSARFYEGLTPGDVAGVTLIAEPKANPAILDAFPGAIRCPRSAFLDQLLGPELARPMGTLPPGATVGHLAYYLARHLGCDPVILVGQDLGFTDGQYYSAGAAIHNVWACELNPFNTLEMMEWQRIKRMGRLLRRAHDTAGRPIYTDEQMATYLVQFERDFLADSSRGLTVIDATEGGVAKRHTTSLTLADALARYGAGDPHALQPDLAPVAPPAHAPMARAPRPTSPPVAERVRRVRQGLWHVADLSRRAGALLGQMLDARHDRTLMDRLIARVDALRDEVMALRPAFDLAQHLNQTGVLKRFKADRAIELARDAPPMERQRRQIERDAVNVDWLAEAADRLGSMLDDAARCLDGTAPKLTRDPATDETPSEGPTSPGVHATARAPRRVTALIPVDLARSGLGTARALAEPFLLGLNPLRLTLLRLARCARLDGAVLLTPDPEGVRALLGDEIPGFRVTIHRTDAPPMAGRADAVRGARLWALHCWRGGLGGFTCYDEVCAPGPMRRAMDALGIDAAVLVGPDWALVDPALTDAVIERYLERPAHHRLTFSQAPPGLAGCVVDRSLMGDLADKGAAAGSFASIGGLLGYVPVTPRVDAIAQPVCAPTAPGVRDLLVRCIPDSAPRRVRLARALAGLGDAVLTAPAAALARLIAENDSAGPVGLPPQVTLELCTGRRTGGLRADWERGPREPCERRPLGLDLADRVLRELGENRSDAALTLAGAGDPLLHADWARVVKIAHRAGIGAVHLRTDLLCDESELPALLDSGLDAISVDLMAGTPEVYRRIMGVDRLNVVRRNLERLLELRAARSSDGGADGGGGRLARPWIVPRLTRCDAAAADLDAAYDRWLLLAGACVIDPVPARAGWERGAEAPERLTPLPLPPWAARCELLRRMTILSDGAVPFDDDDLAGEHPAGNASRRGLSGGPAGLAEIWALVWRRRLELWERHGSGERHATGRAR